MTRVAGLLVTLWAGSLWTVCGLVAPMLFATLERPMAGAVAARLFHFEAWFGLLLGLGLAGLAALRPPLAGRIGPLWVVALAAGAPLASQLALGPAMDAARAMNDMARFGLLHGVAAVLFFTACLGTLALAWRFNRPAG
jgi:uncharacterized protein DUF4149